MVAALDDVDDPLERRRLLELAIAAFLQLPRIRLEPLAFEVAWIPHDFTR